MTGRIRKGPRHYSAREWEERNMRIDMKCDELNQEMAENERIEAKVKARTKKYEQKHNHEVV